MKRYLFIFILLVSAILIFGLATYEQRYNGTSQDIEIKRLIKVSLDIQYKKKTENLELTFTQEFINNIKDNFYKKNLSPYIVLDNDFIETLTANNDEFIVSIRIADRKGSYIQVVHIVKNNNMYLIDNIEYDI